MINKTIQRFKGRKLLLRKLPQQLLLPATGRAGETGAQSVLKAPPFWGSSLEGDWLQKETSTQIIMPDSFLLNLLPANEKYTKWLCNAA